MRKRPRPPCRLLLTEIMDPIDIAAEYLDRDRHSILSADRIKSGLTNESWLVRAEHAAVVVRFSNREVDALQIDRQSETRILSMVADAGIGVPILVCAPERHLLVTLHVKQPVPGAYRVHIDLVYDGEVLQTQDVAFSMPEAIG